MCSQSTGGVAFDWAIRPLDKDGNPDLGAAAVASGGMDYVSTNVCTSGNVNVWTFTGSTALTPGSPYAFVLSRQTPTAGAYTIWS